MTSIANYNTAWKEMPLHVQPEILLDLERIFHSQTLYRFNGIYVSNDSILIAILISIVLFLSIF